jgi:hypothetical protein
MMMLPIAAWAAAEASQGMAWCARMTHRVSGGGLIHRIDAEENEKEKNR